jgi:two-component system NtrC family sensor kinase
MVLVLRPAGGRMPPPTFDPMVAPKAPPILALMLLSIVALGAFALWDERRESAAALDDFAAEQSSLARQSASAVVAELRSIDVSEPADVPVALLAPAVGTVEEPGSVLVLFQRSGTAALVTTSGRTIHSPVLEAALASNARWVRLSREQAGALGLPPRMAIAGLARADGGPKGAWRIAVVATALRVRDREARAVWRLLLGFGLTSAFIAGFGLLAQHKQKAELELARSLALAEAMQLRDERLVRADKLATLGALATGIAHEVSTPLGVIVGRAEQLLPKVSSDERATRSVNVIAEQAERITRIVRAFLRLAGGGSPSLENVSPVDLARAALDLVEHRFAKAQVTLSNELAADLPRVACDPKLFEQALVNILLNACDACSQGGSVELAVRADGERVAFIVTDNGSGITPDVAQRAVEPFFTTKSEGTGAGLGLAIANEIVKHHHGHLILTPRTDARGTRATVELSAVRESEHV